MTISGAVGASISRDGNRGVAGGVFNLSFTYSSSTYIADHKLHDMPKYVRRNRIIC
jgi:hypothetical protein